MHRRGPWSSTEDQRLIQLINTHGPANGVRISQLLVTRTAKQCRERYHQNLKPSLNHAPISEEEGALIESLVAQLGKKWAEIARHLAGRSDNAVKNWWNGGANRRRRAGSDDDDDDEDRNKLPPLQAAPAHLQYPADLTSSSSEEDDCLRSYASAYYRRDGPSYIRPAYGQALQKQPFEHSLHKPSYEQLLPRQSYEHSLHKQAALEQQYHTSISAFIDAPQLSYTVAPVSSQLYYLPPIDQADPGEQRRAQRMNINSLLM